MGLKQVALAFGIAIIFTVFIAYGLFVLYEPPDDLRTNECWKSDCYSKLMADCIAESEAEAAEEQSDTEVEELEKEIVEKDEPVAVKDPNAPIPLRPKDYDSPYYRTCEDKTSNSAEFKECDKNRDECQKEFELTSPRFNHARNSFFILLLIAILAIVAGTNLKHLEGIGSGFIWGGILLILWSLPYTWEYWWNWNKYMKLGALGFVLVLLIYLGYKKIEKKD